MYWFHCLHNVIYIIFSIIHEIKKLIRKRLRLGGYEDIVSFVGRFRFPPLLFIPLVSYDVSEVNTMGARKPDGGALAALLVLGGAFLFGGIVGCLLAGSVGGGGIDSLSSYLQGYLSAVHSGQAVAPGLLGLIWEQVRWPLFAVLLGLTALGLPGLPVLFAARGFFLAFSVGSFVRVFGPMGGIWAFPLFGLSGLFTIPVFFLLGAEGLTRLGKSPIAGNRALWYGLCACALALCVLAESFIAPSLLSLIAKLVSA